MKTFTKWRPILALFLLCVFYDEIFAAECGDWLQYKDEKCFKVIDETLRTFDEAVKSCAALENEPTLAVIHSPEEQVFLTNYLFKSQKRVDNVWIGAKYSENKFTWIDNSDWSYANWDEKGRKNKTDYCVQLQAEDSQIGKWIDEPCGKKNLVVCQKLQTWSLVRLQKTLLDARKELRDAHEQSSRLIADLKHKLDISIGNIADLKQNLIPIGFVYVQHPKDKSPTEIWPWMKWSEVSSDYAGLFFRVTGGKAESFGTIQQDRTPSLSVDGAWYDVVKLQKSVDGTVLSVPKNGWSQWIQSGDNHPGNPRYLKFQFSTDEVRPINMAIRMWKRIG